MRTMALGKAIFMLGVLAMGVPPARVAAQTFDTSGTASLSGTYFFRYVNFFNDAFGNLTESCSLTGTMAFDGTGKYTTSNTQLFDSLGLNTGSCASLSGGTYGVQSNGIAQLDNPLYPATLFGTFSQPVVIASSTEDFYFDLFIAVQAPAAASTNASLTGAYTVGTLDFPRASAALARQGYFNLNADGQGNIAAFAVTGSVANVGTGNLTQNVPASTYALAGTAGGTLTIPVAGSATSGTQIVSGAKILYVSADGNYLVGGAADGSDIIFGFRASSGPSSNSSLYGTYFTAGMEDDVSTSLLDAFYGSINTNGSGDLIWHQRYDDVASLVAYDKTYKSSITVGADGSYFDGKTYTYLVGAGGAAVMLIGSSQKYSLVVGIHAPAIAQDSPVWINPIGITNAANYTPITNAYAPGELVSLYGNFGASVGGAQALPIPTELNGVQVLVNGLAAPVVLTGATQIVALIPYEVSGAHFATFQVVVNGSGSNKVTVYVDNTAPGIYTLSENGIGAGAILHADYTLVTDSSPAVPGETVLLYMNGLGTVTPAVGDGAAAAGNQLSISDENGGILVYLDDGVHALAQANVSFNGLAPGFAGLYQVNFTLPKSGLANGDAYINLDTYEALTAVATIRLSGFSGTAAHMRDRAATGRRKTQRRGAGVARRGGDPATR